VKNLLSMLVAVVGVAAIVLGVVFIMQANSSKTTLENELAPVTLANLNATYDQVKAGLAQAQAAGDAAVETTQSLGWQKAALSVAKANAGTIQFVQMSGIAAIVLGVGFLCTGYLAMKKS
jgi:uncharacterized membrane protein HdeD (DUF308 family)